MKRAPWMLALLLVPAALGHAQDVQVTSAAPASTSSTATGDARGNELGFQWLGPARAISHSESASRDTALVAAVFSPRLVRSAGAELAVASYATPTLSLRLGVFGMLELFGEGEASRGLPFPAGDIGLWRGLFGYSVGVSLDQLAHDTCGERCAFEAALSFRHESEHYTASNDGPTERKYIDYPHIGDFVMPDVAVRLPLGDWDLTLRAQAKIWVSREPRTPYRFGPGGDIVLRWRLHPMVHPFTSTFAERYFASDAPNAYFIRNLTGVMLPSRYGDLSVYFVSEVGHGKGFMVLREEATFGFGMRFALL